MQTRLLEAPPKRKWNWSKCVKHVTGYLTYIKWEKLTRAGRMWMEVVLKEVMGFLVTKLTSVSLMAELEVLQWLRWSRLKVMGSPVNITMNSKGLEEISWMEERETRKHRSWQFRKVFYFAGRFHSGIWSLSQEKDQEPECGLQEQSHVWPLTWGFQWMQGKRFKRKLSKGRNRYVDWETRPKILLAQWPDR